MQPLGTVSITRPWHWGISIISDPSLGGEIPEVEPNVRVSANENGIIVIVRHALDQVDTSADDFAWAEATVTVRHHSAAPAEESGMTAIFEGLISTPTGRLSIGDADTDAQMAGFSDRSSVRVLAPLDDLEAPGQIRVDVWGA